MKRTGKILTAVMAAALTVGLFFGTQDVSAHHRHRASCASYQTCTSYQTCRTSRKCPECGGRLSKGVCSSCHVTVSGQTSRHHSGGHHGSHH